MEAYIRNVWEFKTQTFGEKVFIEKERRDRNLMDRFFNSQQKTKLANLCFNSCVNDFNSSSLSSEEFSCLDNCKNLSSQFVLSLQQTQSDH